MISGINFYKICEWNLCPRYTYKFDINHVEEEDFVFFNLDYIYNFIDFLKNNKLSKINLVTHNSDISFTKDMLENIRGYVNHIYCINSIVSDNVITKIPIGFSDRLMPVISKIDKFSIKNDIVYLNFGGRDRLDIRKERVECYNYFKNFDWVKNEDNIPEIDYYNSLKNSKYSLCPVGQGLDTHRFYESIYFDTIPIIKRNELSDLHTKFPCIIINNWEEITLDFLNVMYGKIYGDLLDWKEKNKNWYNVEYWIK